MCEPNKRGMTGEHFKEAKLTYKHYLLDIKDAILPLLDSGDSVRSQHIEEKFTIGNVVTILVYPIKSQLKSISV